MHEVMMRDMSVKVDSRSELIALSTYGNVKNILVTGLEVVGPLDLEAFKLAIRKASMSFPQVMSRIREVKIKGNHHLFWDHRPDLALPATVTEIGVHPGSLSVLDSLVSHLGPHLDRKWNLFEEVALTSHVVKIAADHHVLVTCFHHVGADAGTASEFGREFLSQYHEIRTGKKPEWANAVLGISSSAKRKVPARERTWKEWLASVRQGLLNLFDRPTLPAGTGSEGDTRQYQIKRVLSEADTELIANLAVERRVSPLDLLTAGAGMAIDQWNEARHVPPGLLTTAVTVNARRRAGTFGQPNFSSAIFFRSTPEQRNDFAAFCRSLALSRMQQFRKQMELKYMSDIELMIDSLRLLPFTMRQRIVHHVANRHCFSLGITALGVLWPKVRNGKPTGESAVTDSAELTVTEVHGIGYKLLSSTRVPLIVYAFRNRLNLVLACSASLFTRQEAEALMDLIMTSLIENPKRLLRASE
jgi:hypothetical protein